MKYAVRIARRGRLFGEVREHGISCPSVQEMADTGEDHSHAETVRCRDDFRIAHRPSRLDRRGRASFRRFLYPIGEWEEWVRSQHKVLQREWECSEGRRCG